MDKKRKTPIHVYERYCKFRSIQSLDDLSAIAMNVYIVFMRPDDMF